MDFDDPIDQQACESIMALIIANAAKTSAELSPYIIKALTTALMTPQGLLISATVATAALYVYMCIESGSTGNPLLDLITCGYQPYTAEQIAQMPVPTPSSGSAQPAPTATATPGTMATTAVEQGTACPTPGPVPTPTTGPCGKIYPNLVPADLQNRANDDRYVITQRPLGRRGLEANTGYLYVVTLDSRVRLGNVVQAARDRIILHHPDLVNGASVAYAGEMRFYNNVVTRWDNWSGHYIPNPEHDQQESDCIKGVIEAAGWGPLPDQSWA